MRIFVYKILRNEVIDEIVLFSKIYPNKFNVYRWGEVYVYGETMNGTFLAVFSEQVSLKRVYDDRC